MWLRDTKMFSAFQQWHPGDAQRTSGGNDGSAPAPHPLSPPSLRLCNLATSNRRTRGRRGRISQSKRRQSRGRCQRQRSCTQCLEILLHKREGTAGTARRTRESSLNSAVVAPPKRRQQGRWQRNGIVPPCADLPTRYPCCTCLTARAVPPHKQHTQY